MLKNYSDAKITGPNSKRETIGYRVVDLDKKAPGTVTVGVFINTYEIGRVQYKFTPEGPVQCAIVRVMPIKRVITPMDFEETLRIAAKAQKAYENPVKK